MIESKLKTKRAKRIALNYKCEKAFRNLEEEEDKAWGEERNSKILVPFDKPIFWKYEMSLKVREDFAQGKEADFWQIILDKINPVAYGKTKKELLKINLKPYRLDSKEFAKLTLKQKSYFRKCIKPYEYTFREANGHYRRKKVMVSYKFTKSYIFKPKFEKLYLTHYYMIAKRSKQDGYVSYTSIHNRIIREYWGEWRSRYFQGSANFTRRLNRDFRTKTTQAIKHFFLAKQFEEEINVPIWKRNLRWLWW